MSVAQALRSNISISHTGLGPSLICPYLPGFVREPGALSEASNPENARLHPASHRLGRTLMQFLFEDRDLNDSPGILCGSGISVSCRVEMRNIFKYKHSQGFGFH